ncbi:MAG TPA: carbon storage regulator CsrA [Candidatus Aminicenantes bacterium]|nr:carbon storage regulator CsrA [Candidatus Aminicenantes bacterium]
MLVLTRKLNESIVIGNHIEIKVLKVGRNLVEIGISAPKELSIFRQEVYLEIQRKNMEAIRSISAIDLKDVGQLVKAKTLKKK